MTGSYISDSDDTGRKQGARVLSGWKEIAGYVGRGVRTVQRWERLGLPVRRPHAHLRSAVVMSAEEMDAWIQACPSGRDTSGLQDSKSRGLESEIDQLRLENQFLRREIEALRHSVPQVDRKSVV